MSHQLNHSLENFLGRYGWDYVKKNEQRLVTGWQGENRSYPLHIEVNETWISFKVQPFLKLDIDWDSWPEIAMHLMELNDGTSMVKLSIDSDGRIILNLDIFVDDLSFERFSNVLGVIGHYADSLYDDLLTVLDNVGYRYCESLNILA